MATHINHAASGQTKSGRVPADENGRRTNMISSAGGAGAGAGVGTGVALANRALKLSTKVFRVKSHAESRRGFDRREGQGEYGSARQGC